MPHSVDSRSYSKKETKTIEIKMNTKVCQCNSQETNKQTMSVYRLKEKVTQRDDKYKAKDSKDKLKETLTTEKSETQREWTASST